MQNQPSAGSPVDADAWQAVLTGPTDQLLTPVWLKGSHTSPCNIEIMKKLGSEEW